MQLMPATGKVQQVGDISQVEANIHAGVKYMRFMMDQYFKDEPMDRLNKGLFTFASYNAGPARIRQLRKEAEKQGLDPNVWFGNVEQVASERIGRAILGNLRSCGFSGPIYPIHPRATAIDTLPAFATVAAAAAAGCSVDLAIVAVPGPLVEEVLAPLARDRQEQIRVIQGLQPWSTTPLNDAIIAGIDQIQSGRGRRGLVVLSDGEDRYSQARPEAVMERARRASVIVYPIALGKRVPPLFPELAALTGGRSFHAPDAPRLKRALAALAQELRFQYLLGYAPAAGVQGGQEWRSIDVRVRRDGVQVRARDGYYAGSRPRTWSASSLQARPSSKVRTSRRFTDE
jgi:hypothetical protein